MSVQRLDKWLFVARFFRTRALASEVVAAGAVRLNGRRVARPSQPVAPGDVLTFVQAGRARVVRVLALSDRRGPAPEAAALYADFDAATAPAPAPPTADPSGTRPLE